MKVKELKKFLEKYDDEVEIITITDNFEMGHNEVEVRIREVKRSKKSGKFQRRFRWRQIL